MNTKDLEIWADSFHEGNWCCSMIADVAKKSGFRTKKTYLKGFIPYYSIYNDNECINLTVYGSYRSWSPLPQKIQDLIKWGKPDFIAYDSSSQKILFAVEETAATPTGNQAMQRCERQYGSARFEIPYWYLISEYGIHRDGGVRKDSIWPTIAALKLSRLKQTPCIVLHYADIDNPEDYNSGSGVGYLFSSLFAMLLNHACNRPVLTNLSSLLKDQFQEMLTFLEGQWQNIIDFLPGEEIVKSSKTAGILARLTCGEIVLSNELDGFLEWPIIEDVPDDVKDEWHGKGLIKYDPLCDLFEKDIDLGKAYYLSDNAGSGKPPSTQQIQKFVQEQKKIFQHTSTLNPSASFSMKVSDFPKTNENGDRRHLTTAKNIVYLYDSWNELRDTIVKAYPRLERHLLKRKDDIPVFVYVSNSLKPGRLFGDPFTGQLSAYSTAFGKFDKSSRLVVAYYPHQVHPQAIIDGETAHNKGITLMEELTDLIIFHAGVAVDLKTKKVM